MRPWRGYSATRLRWYAQSLFIRMHSLACIQLANQQKLFFKALSNSHREKPCQFRTHHTCIYPGCSKFDADFARLKAKRYPCTYQFMQDLTFTLTYSRYVMKFEMFPSTYCTWWGRLDPVDAEGCWRVPLLSWRGCYLGQYRGIFQPRPE